MKRQSGMDRLALSHSPSLMQPYAVAEPPDERPPMIDFRGHNGNSFALPYDNLMAMAFHPISGIRLEFPEHNIVIRGRNLRPLYDHMLQHRVVYVAEDDFDAAPETATFIDSINVDRIQDSV
jgi:hypothetical protein